MQAGFNDRRPVRMACAFLMLLLLKNEIPNMKRFTSQAKHGLHLCCALLAWPWLVWGQGVESWPNRPISLVVASAAGSGVDVIARETAQKLSIALKQPVVVDNKPGASGVLAGTTVARSKPDGYTWLYTNASFMAVAPAVMRKMPYEPNKDLTPVAITAAGGVLLLVNKDVPANNLKELVALVKANPNAYSYGTWGVGSSAHLQMTWLQKQAGLKMNHVPYKSTPQIVNELAAGILQIGWTDPGTPVPLIESKQIKGIAISGNVRAPRTTGIATMSEQGYSFDAVGWFGVFAPAQVPKPIIERMNAEINKILKTPEMAKRMEGMNIEPPPVKTVDEFKAILAKDLKTWHSIASDSEIVLD
jgi:tripartite-type tricarboxylate transporter receptor subunit TctC